MASIDILQNDDDSSDSFPSNEFSMLHEVGESPYKNGVTDHINFDLTNMHSAINETAYDGNAEVNSQISMLISNNLSMKEALNKTNSMMKEQLSNLPSIIDSKLVQQKQNLQKAEEEITSLKKQNAILQDKLDSLLNISQSKDKDFCEKCETLKESVDILFGIEDFNKIDDEMLCNEVKLFHTNLEQNLTSICQHLKALLNSKMDESEKKMLITFTNLLAFKIGNFNGIIQTDEESGYEIVLQEAKQKGSVNGYSHVSSEAQKHLKSLEESLKSKDEELITLRKVKDQLSETVKAYGMKIEALEKELKSELECMKKKLITESSVSETYKERCESLQQKLNNYQEKLDTAKMSENQIIEDLRQEKCNLQEILRMEQQAYQNVKDELQKTIIKLEKSQVDTQRLSQLLEIGDRDGKAKIEEIQAESLRKERENLETIDNLTAQLYEVQDLYSESKNVNTELSVKLDALENEVETITILQQQIQVYKKDFEISELQKKSAQYEMEKLADELKSLKENSESNSQEASPSSSRKTMSFTASSKFDKYSEVVSSRKSEGRSFCEVKIMSQDAENKSSYCNICNKEFTEYYFRTHHMRKHSGEKPYLCHLCDKKFTYAEGLKYHLAKHYKKDRK